jgi:glycosyltransferase involved in cell wall biosynthesis
MVIVSDRPSEWIAKGEVIERYYNPGGLFEQVDLVLTNDDRPDRGTLEQLVGGAQLNVHNLRTPDRFLTRTLGWRPRLVRRWAKGAVELARDIRPQLVRCYGAQLNAFAASEIKRWLGIPYLVSLHINPDEDIRARARSPSERLRLRAQRDIELRGLRDADLVLPVYGAIVPFLERVGVRRHEIAYNMLNRRGMRRKDDYALHDPVEIVSVGRQFAAKRPDNLIRAVAELPRARLTVIGDGSDHDLLRRTAEESGAEGRVVFERGVTNDELCARLPDFDIFATHSDYWELSKSVLEAFVTGLPVLLNRRPGAPVPELTPDICLLVPNTVEDYRAALERLIADSEIRERLGRAAAARADKSWGPEVTEAHFVDVYRRLARPVTG